MQGYQAWLGILEHKCIYKPGIHPAWTFLSLMAFMRLIFHFLSPASSPHSLPLFPGRNCSIPPPPWRVEAPRAPLSKGTCVCSCPLVSVWAPTIHSLYYSSGEQIPPGIKSHLSYSAPRGQTPKPGGQAPLQPPLSALLQQTPSSSQRNRSNLCQCLSLAHCVPRPEYPSPISLHWAPCSGITSRHQLPGRVGACPLCALFSVKGEHYSVCLSSLLIDEGAGAALEVFTGLYQSEGREAGSVLPFGSGDGGWWWSYFHGNILLLP